MDDERADSAIAARRGMQAIAYTYGDDWYAQNGGWVDDLPDLSQSKD